MTYDDAIRVLADELNIIRTRHSAVDGDHEPGIQLALHLLREARWKTCEGCRKKFLPETEHKRKFCSWACAHRASSKAYARRLRA